MLLYLLSVVAEGTQLSFLTVQVLTMSELAHEDTVVVHGDASDASYVRLSNASIDTNEVADLVTLPSTGATSLFVGTTRDNFAGVCAGAVVLTV